MFNRTGCKGVRNYGPVAWSSHIQAKPGLEVRLIKTRKRHVGIHGHKKRVNVFAAVVLVFKASDGFARRSHGSSEVNGHHVLTQLEHFGRQFDMPVLESGWRRLPIDSQAAD